MSAYGTVTRSAPAGRRPLKPSHQTTSFMKKTSGPPPLLRFAGMISNRLPLVQSSRRRVDRMKDRAIQTLGESHAMKG